MVRESIIFVLDTSRTIYSKYPKYFRVTLDYTLIYNHQLTDIDLKLKTSVNFINTTGKLGLEVISKITTDFYVDITFFSAEIY